MPKDHMDYWHLVGKAAAGEHKAALDAYRAGFAIAEALARCDPGNTQWQRDLSVSHNRIGDALTAEGERAAALDAYRAGLAIAEALARRDPGNTQWQRDLIVSCVKVTDVDPPRAAELLGRVLSIARGLEEAGKLAPIDAWTPAEFARRLDSLKPSPSGI
jgi:hypothetical protein